MLAGTIFLVASLYMIGNKRNLFSNTFRVQAEFHDVNGLMPGNNVRFSGIDVGTVEHVEILNGNTVTVTMIIEDRYKKVIRKNAIASIGTDGLMGNKLVNINAVDESAPLISDGDVLTALQPIDSDEMVRTLGQTNENMKVITDNLKTITAKINNSNSLWNFLSDTLVADDVRKTIVNIRLTSQNSAILAGDLSSITHSIRYGNGVIGMLITDTTVSGQVKQSLVTIQAASDRLAVVSGDLSAISAQVRSGEGTIGTLVMDTAFVQHLDQSVINLQSGTAGFNENMEALKHSFLLRAYFRKQAKNNPPAPK